MKMMKTADHNKILSRRGERGYTMIILLVMMTLFALAMLAAAPMIQQEVQREKELEAIRRGEEIAEAIEQYVNYYQGARLPNSLDDLLEGLPQGTKKRQILRPSAAIDPLSEDGKWALVAIEGKSLQNFARRVQNYNNGALPSSETVHRNIVNRVGSLITNIDTKSEGDTTASAEETDEDEGEAKTDKNPFIGVVSQSKANSVIAYYGIENHSKWIFTPLFRGTSTTSINNTPTGRDDRNPNRNVTPF